MGSIVIIDDDNSFAPSVADRLVLVGHDVSNEHGADAGVALLKAPCAELVVLDPTSKTRDGEYLVRRIREQAPNVGILALGAVDTEADVVLALRLGADDYLTRPVRMIEFLARVDALLRRRAPLDDDAVESESYGVWLDPSSREVRTDEGSVALAPVEYAIFEMLFSRAGTVVSRVDLLQALAKKSSHQQTRAVHQHILELRRKLTRLRPDSPMIETIRGLGYRVNLARQLCEDVR